MQQRVVVFNMQVPADILQDLNDRYQVQVFEAPQINPQAFQAALRDTDGLYGVGLELGARQLDGATRLKVIASVSTGVDNYDLDYLRTRNVVLTHTPDAVVEATADTGFLLIMMTLRRAVQMATLVQSGQWQNALTPDQLGWDVHGKTLGIIGFGRIGQALAQRAHCGFGMRVLYSGHRRPQALEHQLGAVWVEQDDLLSQADVVCLCVPLTAATRHLIDARALGRMRSDAVLVNIARGAVVDEQALINALAKGHLRAAGLDVFEREPLSTDSPLLQLSNVVLLPHMGTATHEARWGMARTAADDLIAVLEGRTPRYAV